MSSSSMKVATQTTANVHHLRGISGILSSVVTIKAVRRGVTLCLAFGLLVVAPGAQAASRLETWTLHSRFINPALTPFNGPAQLRVNVLLPPGYNGRRRFPLLLLLHGHGDNYASWMDPAHGDLPALAPGGVGGIVVMPDGAQGWYTDWWDGGARGGDGRAWESFYLDQLLPLIQRRLRVLPDRRYHAVAGLSMGGEGAIYLGEQRPDYFGTVASFSGVLSILRPEWPTGFGTQGQDFNQVYGAAGGFYAQGHDPTTLAGNLAHTRVFVRVGDGVVNPPYPNELTNYFGAAAEVELRQHAQDFVAAVGPTGAVLHYEPVDGIHDWPWWRLAFSSFLQWGMFGSVSSSSTRWTYETVRSSGRAWGLRFQFSRPPTTLEKFQLEGRRLTATGAGRVTIILDSGRRFTGTLPFTRVIPAARGRGR
jgi:S-formylglutathione hydrolase FrmB